MKLIDYNPDDQVYFIQSFINRCQSLCDKINDDKETKNPNVNEFLLSQIIQK